jgi:phage major head subunit gpT-like protein
MQITPASLAAMFFTFDQSFQKGLTSAEPWHTNVATEVPSSGESVTYPLLDKIPGCASGCRTPSASRRTRRSAGTR